MGHDQGRNDSGDRDDRPGAQPRTASSSHVPPVDWIHGTDLDRLLVGEPPEL